MLGGGWLGGSEGLQRRRLLGLAGRVYSRGLRMHRGVYWGGEPCARGTAGFLQEEMIEDVCKRDVIGMIDVQR